MTRKNWIGSAFPEIKIYAVKLMKLGASSIELSEIIGVNASAIRYWKKLDRQGRLDEYRKEWMADLSTSSRYIHRREKVMRGMHALLDEIKKEQDDEQ